ncbi:DUF1810 domain-containing protein [Microbulbifer sp. VAAF005]|uniref:DUF1810 domain-containing protein n=1 Tax=Microbulbifer sp. VAAF005 TaxID=3034230 RepID=UPI0024ACF098|nr:DUF1810 domain-containing protein [Microbulbifer sp. VAAF005]WHI45006.1 DUF1810 domain-containing protein [Microbulbifer sp. VAAF005]
MAQPFHLERFVTAQESSYESALSELHSGHKRSHWMWYIFPQISGLGHSATSEHFAIKNLDEARAYLEHPVLGPRLKECCKELLQLNNYSAYQIFGSPDDVKLKSSMTLFSIADPKDKLFEEVLEKYYEGQKDLRTFEILKVPIQH